MTPTEVQIVLVEDDAVDAEAVCRAFRKQRIANPIVTFPDGEKALEGLRAHGHGCAVRRPFMILLDLNMPRMNGLEFLDELRRDPDLRDSIVFVLTTSDEDQDKVAAYHQNIAGYMLKSAVGREFVDLLSLFDHYWRIVEFPGERPH